MKIYINSNYEIKAINSTTDETLQEIEVDRELVFGTMSDFMILNYCYKPSEYGYSIYPAKDYSILELLDNTENKISILEVENETLKLEQEQQNEELQEEVATLSYEVMMLQPDTVSTIALSAEEHSPKFKMIKIWYKKGFWTEDMVQDAVNKGVIIQEEFNEIVNK